jgi:hypothetical protein
VFDGIGGTLSAKGTFGGKLEVIAVDGETTTPDFSIDISGQPVPLTTNYHAVVDATNGNTTLDPVNARFLQTSLVARGGVYEVPGVKGRVIKLDIAMDSGRLEDIMRLAVKTPTPPMTGRLHLTTKFEIPPGKANVVKKLKLDGRFNIENGRFTNVGVQTKINRLSRRARGQAWKTLTRRRRSPRTSPAAFNSPVDGCRFRTSPSTCRRGRRTRRLLRPAAGTDRLQRQPVHGRQAVGDRHRFQVAALEDGRPVLPERWPHGRAVEDFRNPRRPAVRPRCAAALRRGGAAAPRLRLRQCNVPPRTDRSRCYARAHRRARWRVNVSQEGSSPTWRSSGGRRRTGGAGDRRLEAAQRQGAGASSVHPAAGLAQV